MPGRHSKVDLKGNVSASLEKRPERDKSATKLFVKSKFER